MGGRVSFDLDAYASYFLFCGHGLRADGGANIRQQPNEASAQPLATSQSGVVRKPYAQLPEPLYQVTGTNFAAPRKAATDALAQADDELKSAREVKASPKPQIQGEERSRPGWSHTTGNPISVMMSIH
jgi:hypothetical protein